MKVELAIRVGVMSQHKARISWKRESSGFSYETYNREHEWLFENGLVVQASAAPDFRGSINCVDPEEAFVAAVSSCHMLTFLAICARRRITVDRYIDQATGYLEKNSENRLAITRVELQPDIRYSGQPPSGQQLLKLHERSHQECFIANSVHCEIIVLPPRQKA